jgi:competence protein ComEC
VDSVADSSQSTMAVVSVGKSNQFGMPDAQVLDRWRNVATIHRTSETGAVWLRSDGRAVWQVRWE